MSAAAQTKIFGMRIGVDPKILVGGLIVIAVALFWYSSRSDDESGAPASAVRTNAPAAVALRPHVPTRRAAATGDRSGALRLRPVDATRGDVDPTLRLEMLIRLEFVKPQESSRNLFELGPGPAAVAASALAAHAPILMPKTPPGSAVTQGVNAAPVFNTSLKYYGFVKAAGAGESNRGLFLDGDNVLVASEGDVLKQRYLVVELRDTSARLEDVQAKLGGTLPVVPVAIP